MNLPRKRYTHVKDFGEGVAYVEFAAGSLQGFGYTQDGEVVFPSCRREQAEEFAKDGFWIDVTSWKGRIAAAPTAEDVGMQLFYCRQRLAADSPLQPGLARAAEIVKAMKEQA